MNKGQIITDYRQARNRRQMISILAQLNDCTRTKIENVLREAGLDIPAKRKTKAWRRVNYAEVERLYGLGYTDGEIARTMEIGRSTVIEWRKAHGLSANVQEALYDTK